MKIRSVLPLAAAVLAAALALPALAEPTRLTLLHINDVYQISPQRGAGGLAELMTLLKRERARAEHHLTTLGGDLISPSVMSGLTQGAQMIALMNAIRLDLAGFGNHEFDFGAEALRARIKESEFTWLATNTLGADGAPFGGAAASVMRQVGDFKIGIFSLLTPETSQLSSPGTGVTFRPVEAVAEETAAALRASGADVVIALTHLDLAHDRALARANAIDIILGGHEHDPIMIYEGSTLILKAGTDARYLAVADIVLEKRESGDRVQISMRPEWRLLSTAGIAPDPAIAALVKDFEDELDVELGAAVGTTGVELDSRRATVRSRESAIGNLIADAIREHLGADIGLTNGGGIRGDRTYPAGATLTRKDILTELPFGNVAVLIELTGVQLLAALENGVSRIADTAGRFPQVSGLSFAFDADRDPGQRVLDLRIADQPLDPARLYRLATNDFIHAGGDGYAALAAGRPIVDASGARLMANIVMDYIAQRGVVAPMIEGRITAR